MGQQSHYPHATFVPWEDRIHSFEETDEGPPPIWSPSPDWLPDDDGHSADDCDDPVRTESPWNAWQRDNDDPILAVLVLELLGEPCDGMRSFKDKEDVMAAFDDTGHCGLFHGNWSALNVLECKDQDAGQKCPRHGVVHRWRIIDFDRSRLVDFNNVNSRGEALTVRFNWSVLGPFHGFDFFEVPNSFK